MAKIKIYQLDKERARASRPTIVHAFEQKTILGLTMMAAIEAGLIEQAFEIDVRSFPGTDQEASLHGAWKAAMDIATPDATILSRSGIAHQTDNGDLYVAGTRAWINEGGWFAPYTGPLPQEAASLLTA